METLLRIGLGNAASAAMMAVVVTLLVWFFPRRPALHHRLWLLVLLKLMMPPLWEVPIAGSLVRMEASPALDPVSVPEPTSTFGDELAFVPLQDGEPWDLRPALARPVAAEDASLTVRWIWVVGSIWLTGSIWRLGVAAVRVRRFQRVLKAARPASDEIRDQVEALARRLGLSRIPIVQGMPGAVAPMVWAWGCRARLLVPEDLWARLDERQRVALLVHELAHIRRRDHLVRVLELLATGLYWWFPVVWWARRSLREAEEPCCDAWVTWVFPDSARSYAEALLETVDFLSVAGPGGLPVMASGFGHVHSLRRRLVMIMQRRTPRSLSWGGVLATFGLAAALLPLAPGLADEPGRDDPGRESAKGEESPGRRSEDRKETSKRDESSVLGDDSRREKPTSEEASGRARDEGRRRKPAEASPRGERAERRESSGRGEAGERRKDDSPASPADLEKARDEVKELVNQVRMRQEELMEISKRLGDASARLARLEGRPMNPDMIRPPFPPFGRLRPPGDIPPEMMNRMRPRGPEERPVPEGRPRERLPEPRGLRPDGPPSERIGRPDEHEPFRAADDQKRIEELERKLNRVLEQLEKIQEAKGGGR